MGDQRVIPMKLFATWEVDRSASNCVPRVCTMTIDRLVILKNLEQDLSSFVFAVKPQGNKRTLRSNDITLPTFADNNGSSVEIDLDISFTLQYPHFVKKNNNFMYIMLQRRKIWKKYKNRPMPGFKTLAVGTVNLTEVLQRCVDRDLCMFSDEGSKEDAPPQLVARVRVVSLSSQSVEQEDSKGGREADQYSDDEDDDVPTSEEGGSDSEPILDEPIRSARRRHSRQGLKSVKMAPGHHVLRQHGNIKQKIVSLLKRFKVTEEAYAGSSVPEGARKPTEEEIQAIFEELEDLSPESGPEMDNMDTISVKSTPKPGLRPYFNSVASSREAIEKVQNGNSEDSRESDTNEGTDADGSDVPSQNVSWTPRAVPNPAVTAPSGGGRRFDVRRLLDPKSTSADQHVTDAVPTQSSPSASVAHLSSSSSAASPSTGAKDTLRNATSTPPSSSSAAATAASTDKKRKISAGARCAGSDSGVESTVHKPSSLAPVSSSSVSGATPTIVTGSHSTSLSSTPSSSFKSPAQQQLHIKEKPEHLLPGLNHKPVSEQLAEVLPQDSCAVPVIFVIISATDFRNHQLVGAIQQRDVPTLLVTTINDMKAALNALLFKIQKFCNSNNVPPNVIKLLIVGGDRAFSNLLRVYTELLAQKPSEWLHHIRFFAVSPNGGSSISRYLCSIDPNYSQLFADTNWRESWEKAELTPAEAAEMAGKIFRYVQSAHSSHSLPIAEAMLAVLQSKERKDKSGNEEQNIFIPFIVDVRIRGPDASASCETPCLDSSPSTNVVPAGSSPPATTGPLQISPPSSPHAGSSSFCQNEPLDLHIDYWTVNSALPQASAGNLTGRGGSDASGNVGVIGASISSPSSQTTGGKKDVTGPVKCSLKTAFRSLVVATRLLAEQSQATPPTSHGPPGHNLNLMFSREKKQQAQKMLQKLGMKNKEKAAASEEKTYISGISRLLCSANKPTTMKVIIDGVEWTNVKGFQVSAQWQTHVKNFPVAVFGLE